MTRYRKTRLFVAILGASTLILTACQPQMRANHPHKTNHFASMKAPAQGHFRPTHTRIRPQKVNKRAYMDRYRKVNSHHHHRPQKQAQKRSFTDKLFGRKPKAQSPIYMPQFQQWVEYEPVYKLYPGDQIDIVVSSAPELSRTLTIGPDGRIVMPMAQPIMAAGRSLQHVQHDLKAQLAKQLRDPTVAITPRAYGPQQIYVGGEVGAQGTYTLPGPIGALEAIFMAGGLRDTAKTSQIAVLRRAPNGGMMMRTVNIGQGLDHINRYNDVIQLRRGDIIFVPKTRLAEVGIFVQAVRNVLPVDFNLSYQFGNDGGNGTTVITP